MLNHFDFQDNKSKRSNSQPSTFSRFAGPGSHRYPVGFSGDTIVSWASLEFQPELTNCASNIGYGWWSHDIGGHMRGKKDDELATRWLQYGVFSPIMRLHSAANEWNSKEPWNHGTEACAVQTRFLQLRHKLLPYLQAMNIRSSLGEPLCQPMYWDHPERNEAYEVPNQYMFGDSLLVAPITSPRNAITELACTKAWLPPENWVDIFNGKVFEGNRKLWLHRSLDQYPVFAPMGAIIPLDASIVLANGCPIRTALEVIVIVGKNGRFELRRK
jgi:alpha-glucosidase (family GH31 glycosyl hydrolase)